MAERHHQAPPPAAMEELTKGLLREKGPSASQVLAVVTLLPIGGILLALSGIILAGTVIGLAAVTPLFVIFSPVLVPVALAIGLAVMGFLASGAFGLTALMSLSWVVSSVKGRRGPKRRPPRVPAAR
ncbi:oleosin 18.2 kDa-like [Phoenix dactylifera]|uniref:Oleosin 18.2 kDa-like n=1 Tax=Phoenix dactylifera TaxID=42345 RepID=A0A8B7BT90_PHODC|nr:oleosin 18.2 kDa-like [Phoenix dactylifera]